MVAAVLVWVLVARARGQGVTGHRQDLHESVLPHGELLEVPGAPRNRVVEDEEALPVPTPVRNRLVRYRRAEVVDVAEPLAEAEHHLRHERLLDALVIAHEARLRDEEAQGFALELPVDEQAVLDHVLFLGGTRAHGTREGMLDAPLAPQLLLYHPALRAVPEPGSNALAARDVGLPPDDVPALPEVHLAQHRLPCVLESEVESCGLVLHVIGAEHVCPVDVDQQLAGEELPRPPVGGVVGTAVDVIDAGYHGLQLDHLVDLACVRPCW